MNLLVRVGVYAGLAVLTGIGSFVLLSRHSEMVKKSAARVLSHALEVKDKAAHFAEQAKESLHEIKAEAREELKQRQNGRRMKKNV